MTVFEVLLAIHFGFLPIVLAQTASSPSVISLPGPKSSERCPNGTPSTLPPGSYCATILTAVDKPAPTASCTFDSASCVVAACLALSTLTVPCIQPSDPCCGATSSSTSYVPCLTACPTSCGGTSYVMVTTGCPTSSGDGGGKPTSSPPTTDGSGSPNPSPTSSSPTASSGSSPSETVPLLPHPISPSGSVPTLSATVPRSTGTSGAGTASPSGSASLTGSSAVTASVNAAARVRILGWL